MTNNKEAWKKYYSTTDTNKELDQTWRKEENQENWVEWEKIVHKILNETFGKVRITNNNKQGLDKEVKDMMNEKREIRRKTKKAEKIEEKDKLVEKRRELESQITKWLEEKEEKKMSDMTKHLSEKEK